MISFWHSQRESDLRIGSKIQKEGSGVSWSNISGTKIIHMRLIVPFIFKSNRVKSWRVTCDVWRDKCGQADKWTGGLVNCWNKRVDSSQSAVGINLHRRSNILVDVIEYEVLIRSIGAVLCRVGIKRVTMRDGKGRRWELARGDDEN
jgi:hypothetical protein